eukprot:TRINITY_DN7485_c0_g1_i5.p1 TRINITY_DN7485_c0_g1~~TRINITY_DN7485_c0_g1_i5.p1  ORF type:complete len:154 (+),score=47.20 TRINITY_DN7485_c0_g1_i5:28-489(+)
MAGERGVFKVLLFLADEIGWFWVFFFFFFLMIRRPPRSTHCISSAASDVYKRQVKILAKQLELSIKTKIGMDSRIQELEEFILMLLDENQDAPKASQYLNLRNRQVRRSDILKANSENQQPVSYILQGLNKQDKSIKSPQDKFTTKIQLQMQQ